MIERCGIWHTCRCVLRLAVLVEEAAHRLIRRDVGVVRRPPVPPRDPRKGTVLEQ